MKFASFISSVTEPMLVFLAIALFGGWQAGLRTMSYVWYVAYLLVVSLCIAYARIRFMKSLRTNWDVSDRHKRVRLLLLLLGFSTLFFLSLWMFQSQSLMRLSLFFFLWLLGFFLITLKIKISGHMAALTFAILWFRPVVFLLPLVAWSRIVLERHTVKEVIGGTLYSLLWLSLARPFLMK